MATSYVGCCLLILLAGTFLVEAQLTCKKMNDCACTAMNGSTAMGLINFYPMVSANGAKPMYMVNGTSQQTKNDYTYSYNPCMGFNVTTTMTTESPCTNDLVCQTDIKFKFVYNVGALGSAAFAYVNTTLYAYYYSKSSVNRTTEIQLICDQNETHGKFEYVAESKKLYYQFKFTSMCACPGKCPNKTMIPDKWVQTYRCSYRNAWSGQMVNLQGLDTPLKVAIDEYTTYYYDPCNGLELASLSSECKNMAVCKQDASTSPATYRGIGSKEPEVSEDEGDIVLHYPAAVNGGNGFSIKFVCDLSADKAVFRVVNDRAMVMITKHACPH